MKFMLAKDYTSSKASPPFWASEKLDGVRAMFWNGSFHTRNNHLIQAPQWFREQMPKSSIALDGELYTKRNDFQKVQGTVSKHVPVDDEWRKVKFMAFDAVSKQPFEERLKFLNTLPETAHFKVVPHQLVRTRQEVQDTLERLVNANAEGLMLRIPGTPYEAKRTSSLLKYKKFKDHEAVVVGHEAGTGKFANVLGKLVVTWVPTSPETKRWAHVSFKVGSGFSEEQRAKWQALFPMGRVIKVKYFDINAASGKPRFPVFLGFPE
jgi:DNA ligase 1